MHTCLWSNQMWGWRSLCGLNRHQICDTRFKHTIVTVWHCQHVVVDKKQHSWLVVFNILDGLFSSHPLFFGAFRACWVEHVAWHVFISPLFLWHAIVFITCGMTVQHTAWLWSVMDDWFIHSHIHSTAVECPPWENVFLDLCKHPLWIWSMCVTKCSRGPKYPPFIWFTLSREKSYRIDIIVEKRHGEWPSRANEQLFYQPATAATRKR